MTETNGHRGGQFLSQLTAVDQFIHSTHGRGRFLVLNDSQSKCLVSPSLTYLFLCLCINAMLNSHEYIQDN